ncbi:MAG: hypothetical protein ACRC14_17125, partial [Paracoccaceae bacterium]
MMRFAGVWGLAAVLAAPAATAETTSEIVYSHKHWEVEIVGFDDGSLACLAEVDAVSESFSIWTYQDESLKLQFYSTAWEFGE